MHPLDLKEIKNNLKPENLDAELDKLLSTGGFPEPFLNGSSRFYNRWKKSHLDIIVKQDLIDLENVQQMTPAKLSAARVLSWKTFPDGAEVRSAHRWLSRLSLR